MSTSNAPETAIEVPAAVEAPRQSLVRRLRKDCDGATAIEFAMVSGPFLMLLFGIIAVGLYFFTTFSLENAVEQASRSIRTGQAQQTGWTAADFKTAVCQYVPGHIDCAGKITVNVKSFANPGDITAASIPSCLDAGGNLNAVTDYVPGAANSVVLVMLCYQWDMAKWPWLDLSNMGGNAMLIQATTVFRTEPYSN